MVSLEIFIVTNLPASQYPWMETLADILHGELRRTVHTACLEIWERHPAGTLKPCSDLYRDLLTFYCRVNHDASGDGI